MLDLDLERARRSGTAMGVLIGDLDDFKDFNDRLGHHLGDLALQRVGRLLDEYKGPWTQPLVSAESSSL